LFSSHVQEPDTNEKSEFSHHKKHKRKHRRKHDETTKVFEENSVEKCDENNDNFQYCDPNHQQTIMSQRPRITVPAPMLIFINGLVLVFNKCDLSVDFSNFIFETMSVLFSSFKF
jgi:hypothetical protein